MKSYDIRFGSPWVKGFATVILVLTSCKQAGYQVLRPGAGQSPENFAGPSTIPPTAAIEVIDQGVAVTWTYVGNNVDVRPTLDTLDTDYLGKSQCDNPGIIQASYDLANGTKPVVERAATACDSLATKQVSFSQPGDYLLQLQVKSLDNEVAWASMTLRVIDKNTARDQIEGGFTIHAKPILASVGQSIHFTGICELRGRLTINWDLADQTKIEGAAVQHAYAAAGQYRVTAVCSNDAGRSLQASLTVVVVNGPAAKVADVVTPVPGTNPNLPPANCNPTQGPCQNSTQMPQGKTSTTPTSSTPVVTEKPTVWYYDPYCACYWHY